MTTKYRWVLAAALTVACHHDPTASADAPAPSAFVNEGQLDGTTWVKHDTIHHVTCWEFYYEHWFTNSGMAMAGGISCLPDQQVTR